MLTQERNDVILELKEEETALYGNLRWISEEGEDIITVFSPQGCHRTAPKYND